MSIFAKYSSPGKHVFLVQGEVGDIEVEVLIPDSPDFKYCGIIGHPHSLHGGTMYNKVVTTTAAAFSNLNIPSIKFNFRGVGKTAGEYEAGIGESIDMLQLANLWQAEYPNSKLIFAGFSFGSYVAYRAAIVKNAPLITIAPSVINYNYKKSVVYSAPWLVIQGEKDEIVSPQDVYDFVASCGSALELLRFQDTTHFFHGKLVALKAELTAYLTKLVKKL